jgi:hypothetical protein
VRLIWILVAVGALASGCQEPTVTVDAAGPASETSQASEGEPPAPEAPLATPSVIMEADPPPPFTYWAPEGSVVRNHDVEGIWTADLDGLRTYYFGDGCGASRLQRLVGQPVEAVPSDTAGWRIVHTREAVTQDLRRDRTNVVYNEATRLILSVSCH